MKNNFLVENLNVFCYKTRQEMGTNAAAMAEVDIKSMLQKKSVLNIIFAAAPSQTEFLNGLINRTGIDWHRINAFHMDEYIGLPKGAPQKFSTFLGNHIFGKVNFNMVHLIDSEHFSPEEECARYSDLLGIFSPDIVFMGIGENGHIAFNDPPVADFSDPKAVKIVDLDQVCRQQQVNDGCFSELASVPAQAITLTIPALMKAEKIFCIVPGTSKAQAVYNTLKMPVVEAYPSTILRMHPAASLFLDADSSMLL